MGDGIGGFASRGGSFRPIVARRRQIHYANSLPRKSRPGAEKVVGPTGLPSLFIEDSGQTELAHGLPGAG